jgi:periplasmic protein TonB
LELPKPISLPDPKYPDALRRANIGGTVELQLEIGADGLVKGACVLRSSNHAELDASALAAVRTWRWHPARKDGTPIDYTMNVEETISPR